MVTNNSPNTFQEQLWRGDFGDAYINRNDPNVEAIAARTQCWAEILRVVAGAPPRSILEVGANIGLNLRALSGLCPAALYAVEPNETARKILVDDSVVTGERALDGVASSIALPDGAVDFAFTSGVLIHIHPDDLLASCREIHRVSGRYIGCVEYFSDRPVEIPYREQREALFKRDFGAFYLENFPDLEVAGYGFFWKRISGLDNLTWWVFEKRG